MINHYFRLFSSSLLIFLPMVAVVPRVVGQNATDIIRQVEQNLRGDCSYTEMKMTTVRPRYTREITMKGWSSGQDYALIVITSPARDQGTAFLKRKNEMWNYVPSIDRTVKMPPSMMSQSWMGSDFTNDDLVRGLSIVNDFTHRLTGETTLDEHHCYIIELTPRPDVPVVYDRVIYYVDTHYLLPVRVMNYDEKGKLVNTIYFRDFRKAGARTIPFEMEMVPENKPGHRTILTTLKADFSIKLSEDFFTIQNLTRVK